MRRDKPAFRARTLIAFAGIVCSFAVALRAADPCPPAPLVAATDYPTEFGPSSTTIADFTNDEKTDVLVTTLDGLMVYPGNGDGTLGVPIVSLPNSVGAIATGHFDGDQNLDIAIAEFNNLYVLLGNGDGTFQAPVSYPSGGDSLARIATGFFDADAQVDLIVTDGPGHAVRVFLGNSDGSFTPQTPIAILGSPSDVAVADFNGDGHSDLAVALGAFDDTGFVLLLGNGDGTFAAPVPFSTGVQERSIAAADLDGDGKADVVLGDSTGVFILRGSGNATFGPPEAFLTTGNSITQVLAADLDGDGLLDVLAFQPPSILEITQSPSHTFSMGPAFLALGENLTNGDLNGDGLPDFALTSFSPGLLQVVLSTPGAYLSARSVSPGLEPKLLATGDFDGDGQTDLFVSGAGNGADTAVVLNEDGAFRIAWTTQLGGTASSAVAADLDGDGKTDLALAGFGGLSILLGLGDGTFSPGPVMPLGGPIAVVVDDFNRDGIPDVATSSIGNGGIGQVTVFLGLGGGTFQALDPIAFSSNTAALASGDFDGDGIPDLVVAFGGFAGSNTVGLMLGNGDGTFRSGGSFLVGVDPFGLAVGDFDEDGHLDVVAANGGSSNVSLLLGDGVGGFAPVRLINAGGVPVGVAAADIDGDGHLDLAAANSSAFEGGNSISVLLGDGAGNFLAPLPYRTAGNIQAIVAGAFGPSGRNGLATAGDQAWAVNVFLNGSLTAASVAGGGGVIVGSATALSVAATSARPLTYQWRRNGVPLVDGGSISGAATARLVIDPVSFDGAGSYDVLVSDSCGTVASNAAVLSVEFADVPTSSPFHADIITIAAAGITSGCGGGNYCPTAPVRRDQMAVFLLKSEHGSSYVPPTCTGLFADVPCPSPFADWIEQLSIEGVTSGCGGDNYCPASPVTRAQMAVFLLKTKNGSAYVPPAAVGVFGDVPVGSFAADFIEALYNQGITSGCQASPLLYCPGSAVLRQQMATFLVRTFAP